MTMNYNEDKLRREMQESYASINEEYKRLLAIRKEVDDPEKLTKIDVRLRELYNKMAKLSLDL